MANSTKAMQQEAIAIIDVAKTLVDKVKIITDVMKFSPAISFNVSASPIEYLLKLLDRAGITYEEIRLFIVNFLIYALPAVEISVKAILLTNLKKMISCSSDPRIPEKYRKRHKKVYDYNTSQEYGIDINIESIDINDKLSISPLSDAGYEWYFGLEGVEDVYKFARADDFDAFLWFVIHKGKFPNAAKISVNGGTFTDDIHGGNAASVLPVNGTLLEPLAITYNEKSPSSIILGNTFTYSAKTPHIISMCIDTEYYAGSDPQYHNNIIQNLLLPISDDWNSVNWYMRRADQLWKNIGGWGSWSSAKALTNVRSDGKEVVTGITQSVYKGSRDFSKERAICNIQYIDQASSDSPITGLANNKLRLTILPRPLIHVPDISIGEPPWRFKKLLFDAKGNYDPNGKYTIITDSNGTLIADGKMTSYLNGAVTIDTVTGDIVVRDKEALIPNLVECYQGLTVYEFNYDYLMSMRLFDARVIATSLLEAFHNSLVGVNVKIDKKRQELSDKIKEIVKRVLTTDDSEINDCFYKFDNAEYERLLRRAEEKRASRYEFGNGGTNVGSFSSVYEILSEYSATATLEEQSGILHRAITEASTILEEGVDEKDKYAVRFSFITNIVENLTASLVFSLLSPKVLMLLEVNKTLMGGTWEKFTFEDLLNEMGNVIISIVKEIRDAIIMELLKQFEKAFKHILDALVNMILLEQITDFTDQIRDMVEHCPTLTLWLPFGNQFEDTVLDNVDYADISTDNSSAEAPKTNPC